MNVYQFIEREIDRWGEDDVFALIDKGFYPVLTTKGWRWIMPEKIGAVPSVPITR